MSEWIKTSDRLPPRNLPVLVGWRRPTAWGATWQFDVAKFGGKRWLEPMPEPNEEFTAPDCWREIEPPEAIARASQETRAARRERNEEAAFNLGVLRTELPEETRPLPVAVDDKGEPVYPLAGHACGCIECTCDDPERCHGCGAKYCEQHALNR